MSGLPKESLKLLQDFVQLCKYQPAVLHSPELAFYKDWLESIGAKIPRQEPAAQAHGCCGDRGESCHQKGPSKAHEEPVHVDDMEETAEESPESDLDVDDESVVEPEKDPLPELPEFSEGLEVTDEMADKCEERKAEAMEAANDGRVEDAVRFYTEAINCNPTLPVLFAKRAQLFLRLQRPNAAIQDANRALMLNPDSAPALKQRGRANRLLGKWEDAFSDLTLAQKIDYDDSTQEAIKELQPKIKKIQDHRHKYERKRADQEDKARRERLRKAREAQDRARKEQESRQQRKPWAPGGGMGGGMPPGFEQLFSDPELLVMMQDPEVAAAFKDISGNPANIAKHQANPKVAKLLEKLGAKFASSAPFNDAGEPFEDDVDHEGTFPAGARGSSAGSYSTADVD